MAIPDYWEGRYRAKEEGGAANFYFIGDTSAPVMIFSILRFTPEEFGRALKERTGERMLEIMTMEDAVFVFDKAAADQKASINTEYDRMFDDAEGVAGSLRCFVNQ